MNNPKPAETEPTLNCDELSSRQWLDRVNAYLKPRTGGLTLDDFSDRLTYDAWEAGETPEEFAQDVLLEEGYDVDTEDYKEDE